MKKGNRETSPRDGRWLCWRLAGCSLLLVVLGSGCVELTIAVQVNEIGGGTVQIDAVHYPTDGQFRGGSAPFMQAYYEDLQRRIATTFGMEPNPRLHRASWEHLGGGMGTGVSFEGLVTSRIDRVFMSWRDMGVGQKRQEIRTTNRYDRVTATYRFSDINQIQVGPALLDDLYGTGDGKLLDWKYRFKYREDKTTRRLEILPPHRKLMGVPPAKLVSNLAPEPGFHAMMRRLISRAHIAVTVEVEGDVDQNDATYHDGNRITLLDLPVKSVIDHMGIPRLLATEHSRDLQFFYRIKDVIMENPNYARRIIMGRTDAEQE